MHPNATKQKPGWPIIGCIIAVWIVSIGMENFEETHNLDLFFYWNVIG
jgi:hypothetical protein